MGDAPSGGWSLFDKDASKPPAPPSGSPAAPGPAQVAATARWSGQRGVTSQNVTYDENAFYTRATDRKGHSETVTFKLPPETYQELVALVHLDEFPDYSSPSDVCRDALVHVLAKRTAQINDPSVRARTRDLVERTAFTDYVAGVRQRIEWWRALGGEIEDACRMAIAEAKQMGTWDVVVAVIEGFDDMTGAVPEPYAGKVRAALDDARGQLPERWK